VRQATNVLVAVHAGKHAPVHRVLELVFIDSEAHRGAVRIRRGQRRVGVTGEAVRVLELLAESALEAEARKNRTKIRAKNLRATFTL